MGLKNDVREFFDTLIEDSSVKSLESGITVYEKALKLLQENNPDFFMCCILASASIPDSAMLQSSAAAAIESWRRNAAIALTIDRFARSENLGPVAGLTVDAIRRIWDCIALPVSGAISSGMYRILHKDTIEKIVVGEKGTSHHLTTSHWLNMCIASAKTRCDLMEDNNKRLLARKERENANKI